jgi:hypothetical protein
MQLERRQSTRIKLDHLAYINLPAANGGIVLDVSEGGLSFHSAVPIAATDVVRFRLAVGTIKHLEATASVAWLDSTRKSGGLQFTSVPTEMRWQIENWVRAGNSPAAQESQQNKPPETVAAAPTELLELMTPAPDLIAESAEQVKAQATTDALLMAPPTPSLELAPDASATGLDEPFTLGGGTHEPIAETGKEPTVSRMFTFGAAPAEMKAAEPSPIAPTGSAPVSRNPLSMFPAESGEIEREPVARKHSFSIVAAILVLACVVATVTLSYTYRGDAGAGLVWLGQKISGREESNVSKSAPSGSPAANVPSAVQAPDQNAGTQATVSPSTTAPGGASGGSTTGAASGAAAPPGASLSGPAHIPMKESRGAGQGTETGKPPLKAAQGQSAESGATQAATNGAAADTSGGADGDSELALARKYLRDAQSPADTATAAQLLWVSIEKGNTNAEVELAGLYARGEGVQKSCEQARILLTAAVNKGNATARQKLDELKTNGCS